MRSKIVILPVAVATVYEPWNMQPELLARAEIRPMEAADARAVLEAEEKAAEEWRGVLELARVAIRAGAPLAQACTIARSFLPRHAAALLLPRIVRLNLNSRRN